MMGEEKHETRELFTAALALDSPEERARFLDEVCRGKPELRQRLEALLRAHGQAGGFLQPTVRLAPRGDFPAEHAGMRIGRYKLLQEIGEGGFGRVFMAEQKEPVQRKVALKIIKAGMDTKEVIARFEAERQALALMDHPNIAQVFDGGVVGASDSQPSPLNPQLPLGRPYFVMELVRGIPITEYCDRNNLPMAERLQLFIQVCQAVQHAHQKAIIHRDLKPTNILVTLIDGKPVPKIIDFGVAKALGQKLTEKTLFTAFEQIIGTPAYMSPEQAALSGVDVDTRSDIYSLGVLLYELLTGMTPFDGETLRKAALDEIRRMIREAEPPKPSTRLQALVAADVMRLKKTGDRPLTQEEVKASARRLLQIKETIRLVHGDLDWIVMKTLEKDRARRYETAGALAEDLQRHLDHHPVVASPPGAVYRARKFVRRHRMGVVLATSVTVALVAGLIVSLIGFAEARRERDRAVGAEQQALKERDRAIQAEESQLEVLDSFVGRSVEDRAMIPLLEEGTRVARERLGPTNETYLRLIEALAQRYGAVGEWAKALELYQTLIQLNPDHDEHWWSAHAAALAAGKTELSRTLSRGMLSRFHGSLDPWVNGRVAYVLLLSSDRSSDVERAAGLANRAFETDARNSWFRITKGIVAFRMTDYIEAESLMEPERRHSDYGIRCAAAYFSAMARQRRGQTASAKQLLKETSKEFEEFLYAGDFGRYWQTHCQNLFIRAEAEQLILGGHLSPPVTAESLAAAYRKRKPIVNLLENGFSLAAEQKWEESAAAYAAALRNPDLHWNLETRASLCECLGLQMGVAFVKAGNQAEYERLCRLVLDRQSMNPTVVEAGKCARLCFANGNSLPQDLQRRALETARFAAANDDKTPFWTGYASGTAEYYAGDPEKALELLTVAEESKDVCCKGGAMVMRSMALKKLGHDAEAAELLQKAEHFLAEPLRTKRGGMGWDLEICQIALEQARALIEVRSEP